MKKSNAAALLLAGFTALALVVVPTVVSAGMNDKTNFGYCKSGAKVRDMKNCKENGGAK